MSLRSRHQTSVQYASSRELDHFDPDAAANPGHGVAQRIADDAHLMIPGLQQVVERGVNVTMDPEPLRYTESDTT
jgi:hypothetical protein